MKTTSEMVLGTMNFGKTDWGISKGEAFKILDTFVTLGYKKLDTSNFYAQGNSEKIIGEWILANSRACVEIYTKVGGQDPIDKNVGGHSRESILKSVDYSLKRLKTDVIDVLYLHFPDFRSDLRVTVKTIDDLLKEGIVKEWGLSNYTALEISNLLNVCKENSVPQPMYLEQLSNLIEFSAIFEIIPYAQNHGLNVYSWSPLCGGLLTDAARHGRVDNRYKFDNFWNIYKGTSLMYEYFAISDKYNFPMEKLALLFLESNGITPICGFTSRNELIEIHNKYEEVIHIKDEVKGKNIIDVCHKVMLERMPYPYNLLKFMGCQKFYR